MLQYLLIRLWIAGFRHLPFDSAVRLGAVLGGLIYRMDRRHRRITLDNLEKALGGQMDAAQRAHIAEASFRNLGRSLAEIARLADTTPKEIAQRVTIEGFENYQAARDRQKGVICLSAHLGNWEWLTAALSNKGAPLYLVARALDDPRLDALLNAQRTAHGNWVLNKRTAAGELTRLLRAGKTVGFLLDQNTRAQDAVFVDYFGMPAATHKGVAIVALRTGAPVLPLFIYREAGRHRLTIEKAIDLTRTGNLQRDVHNATALFTRAIEAAVRRHPDQWLWVHRRWKTQPPPPPASRRD